METLTFMDGEEGIEQKINLMYKERKKRYQSLGIETLQTETPWNFLLEFWYCKSSRC